MSSPLPQLVKTPPFLPLLLFCIPITSAARIFRQEQVPPEPLPAEGSARDSGAIRFLGSVFTRLLAQNRDIFTGVLFTIHPCAPTSSVNIATRTSLSPVYDYFLKL
jgi:hypothetical protein